MIVTFHTMQHHLFSQWEMQCVGYEGDTDLVETDDGNYRLEGDTERVVDHSEFSADDVAGPGVYKDADGCYTIVVDRSFMTYELCQEWIEKLNEEFDENLTLKKPDSEAKAGTEGDREDG